jgi:hypothetical protein
MTYPVPSTVGGVRFVGCADTALRFWVGSARSASI